MQIESCFKNIAAINSSVLTFIEMSLLNTKRKANSICGYVRLVGTNTFVG